MKKLLAEFVSRNDLSQDYLSCVDNYFLPMTEALYQHYLIEKQPLVIGINGAQGCGKSTLAELMVLLLNEKFKLNCIALSLDDFYLTKLERQHLAKTVHPLLIMRGVPGTHDVTLAMETIANLINFNKRIKIPRFDKASDDRYPQQQWGVVDKPTDIIVLEGWCLGAKAQTPEQLTIPVNELEVQEDKFGEWRKYVNQQLQCEYATLFSMVNNWIMLKAPSFTCVLDWRSEQEAKLRNKIGSNKLQMSSMGIMTENELARFIQFYQRITEDSIRTLPAMIDYLFELDEDRTISRYIKAESLRGNNPNV